MLAYLERIGEKYENFYSLIINEKVKLEEYSKYDQRDLKELIKMDYIDVVGHIKILCTYSMFIIYNIEASIT